MLLALSPAEENELRTQVLCREIQVDFIEVGKLLVANSDRALWSTLGHESFSDYVESLGVFSYSHATRLMGITRLILDDKLTLPDVMEMGVSKATLLLPLKEITEERIEQAKQLSVRELRAEIQGEPKEREGTLIICPRCGEQFRR